MMSEVAPGIWRPSIPIAPTGLVGWQIRRACRRRGGHFYHPTNRWSVSCCQCGHEDDNPNLPLGHYCEAS